MVNEQVDPLAPFVKPLFMWPMSIIYSSAYLAKELLDMPVFGSFFAK
jgi:hypothetical protein